MSEDYDCYKAVRAGHRGALTRFMKEINEVMSVEVLNEEDYQKLNTMHRQLETKDKMLTDLDRDIIKCCDLSEIEKKVQEADVIAAKIIEYKTKLESVKRPITSIEPTRTTTELSEAASLVTRPCLPKLPHLRVMLHVGHPFGTRMTQPYTITHNCRLLISLTTYIVC